MVWCAALPRLWRRAEDAHHTLRFIVQNSSFIADRSQEKTHSLAKLFRPFVSTIEGASLDSRVVYKKVQVILELFFRVPIVSFPAREEHGWQFLASHIKRHVSAEENQAGRARGECGCSRRHRRALRKADEDECLRRRQRLD